MEYRIEQLAQAGGVAVDTIRFYQGKGLLEPPRREGRVTWYSESHLTAWAASATSSSGDSPSR
jgi:DNA-binding transcriptional MerR regulator